MSRDIVADALNMMWNAKKAGKTKVSVNYHSKLLTSILALAKLRGYVKSYTVDGTKLDIELGKINACGSIKPRFVVQVKEIEKFISRYLPAKNMGIIVISTSQGLMTHETAMEKNIGGSLIAYMY